MRRNVFATVAALCLALSLCACAQRPQGAPAASAAGGSGGTDSVPLEQKEGAGPWDYELVTERAGEKFKSDDGTVLAAWSYERPILLMKNAAGEIFGGDLPDHGVTAEQIAVCKAFNDATAAAESASLEAFEEIKAEAQEYVSPPSNEVTVERQYRRGDLISVLAMDYINLGGAHPDWGYVSWNFDLASGEFFTPNALSDDPAALRTAVAECIVSDICASEEYEYYNADFEDTVYRKGDFDVFFGEDGMTVYFQEYEIAPRILGIPEFTIPYARLGRFLSRDAGRLLDLSAEDRALGDYYEAEEMWGWLDGAMPLDYSDIREMPLEDYTVQYYRADLPGVVSLADFRAKLLTRFSEEVADRRMEQAMEAEFPLLREFDGVLYVAPAGRGDNIFIRSVDYAVAMNAAGGGGTVAATVQYQDFDEETGDLRPTGETDTVEFPFEQTEAGARFTSFRGIW